MWLLTLWITFYGVHVSNTIQVRFDTKDKCINAIEALDSANNAIVSVSALCTQVR